jgi:hypothetical protein
MPYSYPPQTETTKTTQRRKRNRKKDNRNIRTQKQLQPTKLQKSKLLPGYFAPGVYPAVGVFLFFLATTEKAKQNEKNAGKKMKSTDPLV